MLLKSEAAGAWLRRPRRRGHRPNQLLNRFSRDAGVAATRSGSRIIPVKTVV